MIIPHYVKKPVATILNGDKLHENAVFGACNHTTDGHLHSRKNLPDIKKMIRTTQQREEKMW